jgi:predicted secreted protein
MQRAASFCALFVAVLFAAPAMAQTPTRAVVVSERQNGSMIEMTRGQRLVVRLTTRSGTGYSWAPLPVADGILRLAKSETRRNNDRPGSAATQIFTFVPAAAGTADVEFDYRRPWLKDKPAARSFRLRAVVRDAP